MYSCPLQKLAYQYSVIFLEAKIENLIGKISIFFFYIFAQNIHSGYTLVLTSTHNVYFGSKLRKLDIPLQTPVFLYKSAGFNLARNFRGKFLLSQRKF